MIDPHDSTQRQHLLHYYTRPVDPGDDMRCWLVRPLYCDLYDAVSYACQQVEGRVADLIRVTSDGRELAQVRRDERDELDVTDTRVMGDAAQAALRARWREDVRQLSL